MKKGFTLIELLVVVLIIGILSAVALPQYRLAVLKARLATVKNIAEAIGQAQEVYYLANGQYATKFSDLDVQLPSGGSPNENDNSVAYDNWGCSMSDPSCTICWNKKMEQVNYLVYHHNLTSFSGKRYCQAEKDSVGEKVCKADTGRSRCPYWAENVATCEY